MILLSVLSNGSFARYEVMIENKSNSECIYVRVFPVGAVFNGDKQYSLQCKFPTNDYQYIIGCSVILTPFGTPRSTIEINHDADGTTGGTKAAIGFGKYMVKFYQVTIQGQDTIISVQSFDSCEIDYSDSDFPNYLPFPGGITLDRDIAFKYYNQDSITLINCTCHCLSFFSCNSWRFQFSPLLVLARINSNSDSDINFPAGETPPAKMHFSFNG